MGPLKPSPSLEDAVAATRPKDWQYTAEGGANLVVSYAGLPNSQLDGKVLRLRKRKRHPNHPGAGEVDLRFAQEVIEPLLGKGTVVEMEKIPVKAEFLSALSAALKESKSRPETREDTDDIDESVGEAVLTEDLVRGAGVLAVEIKPKWGFLPNRRYLSDDTAPLKSNYCRFCMHAYLKASTKGEQECFKRHQGSYCPLSLYSGSLPLTSKAIAALWDNWEKSKGTTNSFRLFLDGERISPSDFDAMTRLHTFLCTATNTPTRQTIPNLSALQQALIPTLMTSPLLPTLSLLQSSLDPLDIEGLTSIILERTGKSTLDQALSSGSLGSQPTIDEWITWRDKWTNDNSPVQGRHLRDLLMAYLLSATFKDCSIFIRLQLINGLGPPEITVKAIDLDPKPLDRLPHYNRLDQDVVTTFRELVGTGGDGLRQCRPAM